MFTCICVHPGALREWLTDPTLPRLFVELFVPIPTWLNLKLTLLRTIITRLGLTRQQVSTEVIVPLELPTQASGPVRKNPMAWLLRPTMSPLSTVKFPRLVKPIA